MTPPERIKVGPFRYKVTTDVVDLMAARAKDSPNLQGACDHEQLTIVIDAERAPGYIRDTVLHEVLHALTQLTAIDVELGADVEEKFVARLTPALLDLLRRNPRLVAFLLASED